MPRPLLPLLVAFPAFLVARPVAAQAERLTLAGPRAAIFNLAGTVLVERGSGSDVVVEVTRRGSDAARLSVATDVQRGVARLIVRLDGDRLVYPEGGRWGRTDLGIADDGSWGDGGGDGVERRGNRWRLPRSRRITISGSGSGAVAWADLVIRVPQGVRLDVHHAAGMVRVAGTSADLRLDLASASAEVQGHQGGLFVDGGSGEATLRQVTGSVTLDLGSGGAHLEGVQASELRIDAGSGGVTGDDVQVTGQLLVDAGSGPTSFRRLAAKRARLDLGSGPLTLDFTGDVDDVAVDAGSGPVELRFPPALGATVDIEAGSGGIESDFPVTVQRRQRGELHGTIGDGRGRIRVEAGSGRVALRKVMAR